MGEFGGMGQVHAMDEAVMHAPVDRVWEAIRDPAAHAQWHPFVTKINGEHAPGALRRCEVRIGPKPGHTEERCTTYGNGHEIAWRIEADSTGFSRLVDNWSAGFTLEATGSTTTLVKARSVFGPASPFLRLMLPVVQRKFHRSQRTILAHLKEFIENATD
jgi:uncharacterized protein YndB with AHSA1/START domain